MMVHEFTERTGYTPDSEEYQYIEQSYYEFDGEKDAFCKRWLEDQKSGKWAMELFFRRELDRQKKEYEAKLAEKEELLDFYRPFCERARSAEAKLRAAELELENQYNQTDSARKKLVELREAVKTVIELANQ